MHIAWGSGKKWGMSGFPLNSRLITLKHVWTSYCIWLYWNTRTNTNKMAHASMSGNCIVLAQNTFSTKSYFLCMHTSPTVYCCAIDFTIVSIVFVHSYLCNCYCAFVLVHFYLCICHCVFEVHWGNDDSLSAGGWEIHFSPQWSLTPTFSRTKLNFSFSAKQLEAWFLYLQVPVCTVGSANLTFWYLVICRKILKFIVQRSRDQNCLFSIDINLIKADQRSIGIAVIA